MNNQLTVAEQPQIKKFNHEMFGELEVLVKDGKEYLPATDVATTLEYAIPRKAVLDHCDEAGVLTWNVGVVTGVKKDGTPATQTVQKKFITIGNVSRLIIAASKQSKNPLIKEKAKQYERWIFDEVIPSIHKHGAYMKPKAMDAKESILANMQVTLLLNKEVSTVKEDLEGVKADVKDLRENASLSAIECEEISKSVRKLGVSLLGGKHSNAYRNRSTRNKVYKDIYRELHRHFDVKSHKAIKRRHLDLAKNKIVEYQLPIVLSEEIHMVNSQIDFSEISQ